RFFSCAQTHPFHVAVYFLRQNNTMIGRLTSRHHGSTLLCTFPAEFLDDQAILSPSFANRCPNRTGLLRWIYLPLFLSLFFLPTLNERLLLLRMMTLTVSGIERRACVRSPQQLPSPASHVAA